MHVDFFSPKVRGTLTDNGTYFMVRKLWPQIINVEDKAMKNIVKAADILHVLS